MSEYAESSDLPLGLNPAESDVDLFESEEGEEGGYKHHTNWWNLMWGALFIIVVIFLALWLFNVYQKWKQQQMMQNIRSGVGQMIQQHRGFGSLLGGGGTNVPGVTIEKPTHVLMQPASPTSEMSPGAVFNNHVGENRVHFFYDGVDGDESRRMYHQFSRLRKRCQRKDFGQKFGRVVFHKCDVSQPEGRGYLRQLQMERRPKVPMVTFANAGSTNEHMIGTKDTNARDMMQNLVNRLPSQQEQQ